MLNLERILRNQMAELSDVNYTQFIERPEERSLDLDSRLAQVVVGVRRCGKSTLCQKVLMQAGVRFAYINFDDETLANLKAEQLNDLVYCAVGR